MRFFPRVASFLSRAIPFLILVAALVAPVGAAPPSRFTATVTGEGPDVLLIPGLACPATVWDATAARLRTTRRVHVLQVAGFAGAPVAGNAAGPVVGPLVEEIAAYIEDRKLERPAIIGHSLGGFSAMALAARHPEMVGRVLAVDASPFFPVTINPAATVESTRPIADTMRNQMMGLPQPMFAMSQAMVLQRMIKDPATRTAVATEAAKSDPKVVARAMHDLMTTDLRSELAAIRVPLTVLYAFDEAQGATAAATDQQIEAAFANARAARLIRMDGSLHFIMLDQPEKFAATVDEFLKQTGTEAR